ncbi:MAG: hypothetical protein RIS36_1274 [Pseudomonadota bacterium]|jgi:hypothetical protein
MKDLPDVNPRLPLPLALVALCGVLIMLVVVGMEASKTPEVFQLVSIRLGLITLAVSALVSFISIKLFKRPTALLVIPVLFCAYTQHFVAFLAWAVFCAASFGLGSYVCRLFLPEKESSFGDALPFLKLFIGLSLNSLLTWVAMHFSVNYTAAYWSFFCAELLLFRRGAAHLVNVKLSRRLEPGRLVVLLHALLFLPFAVVPAYNFDDISSHLFISHQTRLFGRFVFSPELVSGLNPSMLPMGAYTSVFMLGGEFAMRILNLSMYTFGFLIFESFVRNRWGNRVALLATLFAVLTPFTHWTLGICFVDSFFFALSTLFFVCTISFLSSKNLSMLPWLGLLAGLGYLAKQQFIFIAIPLAVPMGVLVLRALLATPKRCVIFVGLAAVTFIVTIAPPLVHNYILSGNPLFPFYNSFFKSPYWPAQNLVDTRWNQPFAPTTLWAITFHGSRFVENSDFCFGFAPLVLFPAIVSIGTYRACKNDLWIWSTLLISVSYVYLCSATTGLYIRYFVGQIAPISLCLALTVHQLLSAGNASRRVAFVIVCALLAGNFAALLSGRNSAEPYPVVAAIAQSTSHSSMAYHARFKTLFEKGRELCGQDATGLLIDSPGNYFAQTRLVSNLWHFTTVSRKLSEAKSTADLQAVVFDNLKACYIIMPLKPTPQGVRSDSFRDLLTQIEETADFGLYIPRKISINTNP